MCGGAGICKHGRERNKCKDCGGSRICAHKQHLPPELRTLIIFKIGPYYGDAAMAVRHSRLACVAWAREIMPLLLVVRRDEAEHRRFLKREKAQQSAALGRMSRAHLKKLSLALTPRS